MKQAFLWVFTKLHEHPFRSYVVHADLVFSSRERFDDLTESGRVTRQENDQLVEIRVPDDYRDFDYVPSSYPDGY